MAIVRLKAGEAVLVAAVADVYPDQGLPTPQPPIEPPTEPPPVDPGYGIDCGCGSIRPEHPIVLPPGETTPPPIPTHPIELPPPELPPVDPGYGIDIDIGYVRPEHPIYLPGTPDPVPNWELKVGWTETTGWIVVAVPTGPHPTPSKKK